MKGNLLSANSDREALPAINCGGSPSATQTAGHGASGQDYRSHLFTLSPSPILGMGQGISTPLAEIRTITDFVF